MLLDSVVRTKRGGKTLTSLGYEIRHDVNINNHMMIHTIEIHGNNECSAQILYNEKC